MNWDRDEDWFGLEEFLKWVVESDGIKIGKMTNKRIDSSVITLVFDLFDGFAKIFVVTPVAE